MHCELRIKLIAKVWRKIYAFTIFKLFKTNRLTSGLSRCIVWEQNCIIYFPLPSTDSGSVHKACWLLTVDCCLSLGVPAIAVGLSAISFSAALQKDAASIPNASGAIKNWKLKTENWKLTFHFQLSTFNSNNSQLIRCCLILYLFRPFRA